MTLLISACWVQVTFGLEYYLTEEYQEVHIYPSVFFSERVEHLVKGLTTTEGTIFISWRDFIEDYRVANNLNVGMHEITHAMLISAAFKHNFDEFFTNYYHEFFENIKEDFWTLRRGYSSYLRGYGGSNFVEFLSVSVEAFFENPAELKQHMPELYYNLSVLLKQNPLNNQGDYKIDKPLVDEIYYADIDHGIPEEVLQQLVSNQSLRRIRHLLSAIAALVVGLLLIRDIPIIGIVAIVFALVRGTLYIISRNEH